MHQRPSGLDLLITNARIIDGTGAPAFSGSVGIRGGRIEGIYREGSPAPALSAVQILDADGLTLTPGFIDLHSHADFSLPASPAALTQITQGVTTLVTGNCGISPFPLTDRAALKAATDFLNPQLDWNWTGAGDYAAALDKARPAVNVVLQVGHGALRIAAMGTAERAPTSAELDRMCRLLRESVDQGVRGFSTGLIYAPGSFAQSAEITALARTAAECGLLYSTHIRNETESVLDAVGEALSVAEETGVRLEISHVKAMGPRNHGLVPKALELIDAARTRGVDVTADVYPYTASSTTLTSRLPGWALDGGTPGLLERLADPDCRERLRAVLGQRFNGEIDPAGIILASLPEGKYSGWTGRSLVAVGAAFGISPAGAALDVLARHQGAVSIINHAMAEPDVEAALRNPFVSVASDGWVLAAAGNGQPHPRSFGTFSRVLGRYVRERGVLSLEEAVRKMTSLPAARAGLADRGIVAPGYAADLAVFDPAAVRDVSTYSDPWQLSEGMVHVLVHGVPALQGGHPTTMHSGRML